MRRVVPPLCLALAALMVALMGTTGARARPGDEGGRSPARVLRRALREEPIVRITAGWFRMGSDGEDVAYAAALCRIGLPRETCRPQRFASETPPRRVFVGAFAIDRTEVSRAAYRRCELDHGCAPAGVSDADPRVGQAEQPVVFVDAGQAARYCAWAGGRLPTEAEWERAARGGSARRFPWGHAYNTRVANHGSATGEPDPIDGYAHAAPVSALPDGRSAHGVLNMAGNVWEWTADRYHPEYYRAAPRIDPRGPSEGSTRVVRGGSWRSPPHELRATARKELPADARRPDLGFRCAY